MSNETNNVFRTQHFEQVCVWPATIVVPEGADVAGRVSAIQEFEKFFLDTYGWRVQYLEEIKTNPDTDDAGVAVEGTGGRNDVFLAIHKDDVGKAAIPRLGMGIRWVEDVLSPVNYSSKLYPDRVRFYQVWPQDGTVLSEAATPAIVVPETNNITKELTMNEEVKVEVPVPAPLPVDPMNQMAMAMLAMLKPHLAEQITAIVRDVIREELFSDKLASLVDDQIESALEKSDFVTCDVIEKEVENQLNDDFIRTVTEEVQKNLDLNELFDNEDFNAAVNSVVEEMEFSVEVSSRRRR